MSTPDFEVHRALVVSSNINTGDATVVVPALLGSNQQVAVPKTGLTQTSGLWNVPSPGATVFVAVSTDRTQFFWLTAVTAPSVGDDRDIVDSLQFNIDANITVESEGLLAWNEDWGTVDIGLHGSNAVLHVGQQVYYYAKNQTGAQIDKGTVVRFDGALGASGHLKMAPFLADGTYPSEYIMGITAHDIPDGDDGYVVHFGAVRGVDTSVWTDGAVVYASPTVTGGLTSTTPSAPNNIILVAAVVKSHAQNGELFVRPTLAANILNNEGIVYTNLADNDVLAYNSTAGVFENTSSLDLTTLTTTGDVTVGGTLSVSGATPIGALMPYVGSTAPDSFWLICDGAAVSRTTYATLFAIVGTTYGSGNGSTTFNLPNLKGRTVVGYDSGQTEFNALGKTGGEKTVTLATTQIPAHSHPVTIDNSSSLNHRHSIEHNHGSFTSGSGSSHSHSGTFASSGHYHSWRMAFHDYYYKNAGANAGMISYGAYRWHNGSWGSGQNLTTNTSTVNTSSTYASVDHAVFYSDGTTAGPSNTAGVGDESSHSHSVDPPNYTGNSGYSDLTHSHTGSTTDTGDGGSHNNLQPYMALNYLIKAA